MSSAPTFIPPITCVSRVPARSAAAASSRRHGPATRPIEETAPALPTGLDPDSVAARIATTIVENEKDLPSTAF